MVQKLRCFILGNVDKLKMVIDLWFGEVWVAKASESYHNVKLGASWKATHGIDSEFYVSNLVMSCHDVKSSAAGESTYVFYL